MLKQKRPNGICKGFKFSETLYEASLTTASLVQITDSLEQSPQLKQSPQHDLPSRTDPISISSYVKNLDEQQDIIPGNTTQIEIKKSEQDSLNSDGNSMIVDSSYDECDGKRISSSSRVNFSKLSKKEQTIRFKNMQKKIQRLQIQVRSLKINNTQLRSRIKISKKPLAIQSRSVFKIIGQGNQNINISNNPESNIDKNQMQSVCQRNNTSYNFIQRLDSDLIRPPPRPCQTQEFLDASSMLPNQQYQIQTLERFMCQNRNGLATMGYLGNNFQQYQML